MIDFFLTLAKDSPVLFAIAFFNLLLGAYILVYFGLYLYKRRHPEIILNVLLWKTQFRGRRKQSNVEELYKCAMERLRKERIISRSDGIGQLARDKSLKSMTGEKREVFQKIYELYEAKLYGTGNIKNEEDAASRLLDRVLSV